MRTHFNSGITISGNYDNENLEVIYAWGFLSCQRNKMAMLKHWSNMNYMHY